MSLELAYREVGEGPPLVILHGLFGSAKNWTTIAKRLGAEYKIYTVDLRNHGESPWADEMSYESMASDVAALMDSLGLAQATVIGHSMGGKAAMDLALTQPERVASLIVVDIAPVPYDHGFVHFVDVMRRVDLKGLTRRGEVDARLADAIPEPLIRSFLLQNLTIQGDSLSWRINLAALDANMAALMDFPKALDGHSYGGPTLFLTGGASDYVRPEHHAVIERYFPLVATHSIAGAGHWVHAAAPDLFLEQVEDFLAGPARRAG